MSDGKLRRNIQKRADLFVPNRFQEVGEGVLEVIQPLTVVKIYRDGDNTVALFFYNAIVPVTILI